MTEPKLRIAQVAPLWASIPPATYGGIELVVHLLTGELVRRGHEVTLFASGDSRTSAKLHSVCETNVIELMGTTGAILYEYYANAAAAEVLRDAEQFDLIHFHAGTALAPFTTLTRTPCLFTMHTFFSPDEEWLFTHYREPRIAGISNYQARQVAAAQSREVPVVYNGIDFDSYSPRFKRGEYLAFLGRYSNAKNPLDAIRIAEKVGMPLLLAGEPHGTEEGAYFEKRIKPLIDGERVRNIGPVNHEQKNELLRNAAALLFPVQWAEPFGLVMVEAMACGTPVVGHALGSVAEVVDQGVTGFHADSIEAMTDLVSRAIELDRRTVRAHAESRFSFQKMVDGYLSLYRSLRQ